MSFRNLFIAGLSILGVSIGATSCTLPKTAMIETNCAEYSNSVACILKTASEDLADMDDAFTKASSMAELAVAYGSSGQLQRAAELIEFAQISADKIQDKKIQTKGVSEIAIALADMNPDKSWVPIIDRIIDKNNAQTDADARVDILTKLLTAKTVHGDAVSIMEALSKLPQETSLQENSKAVALQKTSKILAKKGEFEAASKAIEQITMSISYYQATSRTAVAYYAARADKPTLARKLLSEAEAVAIEQENGYFGGAIFRDIAYGYGALGDPSKAAEFYEKAKQSSRVALKQNEKARAMSRISTKLADAGETGDAADILKEANALAQKIESEMLLGYSYYEIVGSAAISGEFELAEQWLEKVPNTRLASTASLKSAAQRDVAWGYARYGKTPKALKVANAISSPREKVQALSRIVRVLNHPKMTALPRYP